MKYLKHTAVALLGCLILLIGYESLAVMKAREQTPEIFKRLLSEENRALKLVDIPEERVRQLLSIEDPGFYQHNGFDFSTPGGGLTSITQGMVKYLYFDHFEPGFWKIEQTLIAWLAVDALVSKQDQLTVFINTAYFGSSDNREIRGFTMAAEHYFGKSFSELTGDEYLSLVAMLIGPERFSVNDQPERNRERVKRIRLVLSGKYSPHGLTDVYYGQSL